MKTAILIPARIQSSRFPEKMLQPIGKYPLILHVYNKCVQSGLDTFVLTDSKRVASIIPNAIMTDDADNGTERCCQVMNKLEDAPPSAVAGIFQACATQIYKTILTQEEFQNLMDTVSETANIDYNKETLH